MADIVWTSQDRRPPEETDEQFLDRLALAVVRRGLATPAILMLDSLHPLNFVGSQFMLFMDPLLRGFFDLADYRRLASMLEQRDTLERLVRAIESLEEAREEAPGLPPRTRPDTQGGTPA